MKKERKAQTTMFIVIGIIIVVSITLVFFLFFRQTEIEPTRELPEVKFEIESCIGQVVEESSMKLFEGNGYINKEPKKTFSYSYPQGYYKQGTFEHIPFLCYAENVVDCIILEPNFIGHVRKEIEDDSREKVIECFERVKRDVENQGYEIEIGDKEYSITLMPGEIRILVKTSVEVSIDGSYEEYTKFERTIKSGVYEMASIIAEINREESLYSSVNTNALSKNNVYFNIGEYSITDRGIRVYTITDTRSNKEIMFGIKGGILRPAYS